MTSNNMKGFMMRSLQGPVVRVLSNKHKICLGESGNKRWLM